MADLGKVMVAEYEGRVHLLLAGSKGRVDLSNSNDHKLRAASCEAAFKEASLKGQAEVLYLKCFLNVLPWPVHACVGVCQPQQPADQLQQGWAG